MSSPPTAEHRRTARQYLPQLYALTTALPALVQKCQAMEHHYVTKHDELTHTFHTFARRAKDFIRLLPLYHEHLRSVTSTLAAASKQIVDDGTFDRLLREQQGVLQQVAEIVEEYERHGDRFEIDPRELDATRGGSSAEAGGAREAARPPLALSDELRKSLKSLSSRSSSAID